MPNNVLPVVTAAVAVMLTASSSYAEEAKAPTPAPAGPRVAVGIAGGGSFSPTKLYRGTELHTPGKSLAWGFFVDIELHESLYLAPTAMQYQLDLGSGPKSVTDMGVQAKAMVPLGHARIGAGFLFGMTTAEAEHDFHWGGMGIASYEILPKIEFCVMLQYKKLMREQKRSIDSLFGFVAGILHIS